MPAEGRPIVDRFHIKRGDRLPYIEATLLDGDGNPVTLTGITGVDFHMKLPGADTAKVDAPAVIVQTVEHEDDGTTGRVRYEWAEDDTEDAGEFDAEWQVTTGAGLPVTFPNPGHTTVIITADLA